MKEYHISADWVRGLAFDAHIDEHTVRMDSENDQSMNTGPSPKKLVLAGLIGCTGMDVVSLLNKMRVDYTDFRILADAPLTDEHPKSFRHITLKYIVTGHDINVSKVEKAVNLSMERYCGVSAMLSKHCPIDWDIEVREPAMDETPEEIETY